METVQPPSWPRPKGYANGIIAEGRMLFIAGQVGWTEEEKFASDDFVDQVRQALKNVVAVLDAAGGKPEHIVRMTWYLVDKEAYLSRGPEIGAAYREVIGRHFPVMSAVQVAGLVEEGGLVEIECTAVLPPAA